ncbi:hypothetical protein ElyMa_002585500 [Elysia marginata]|uniref:Uncharacterized protein n=1 Tax=Elysia marginata TaxID=1093978 RepID=A0AAV4H139_9GAST|nr:hypothetical protein ElyMa_002585500 [Elysia marginata]
MEATNRLARFRKDSDPSIIVRFTSKKVTHRILSSRRSLKGTGTCIVCSEDLTKVNLDRLRNIKDLEETERAWTKRGTGTIYALNSGGKILKFDPNHSIDEFSAMLKTKTNRLHIQGPFSAQTTSSAQ